MSTSQFILWNNRGADLLQHGRYMQAIECFSKSLVNIQNQIKASRSKAPAPETRRPNIGEVAEHICVTAPTTSLHVVAEAVEEERKEHNDADGGEQVRTKPLHEQEKERRQQQQQQQQQQRERPVPSSSSHDCDTISDCDHAGDDDEKAFVYRQPIRFSPSIVAGADRPLASSILRPLSVLIIINTAIAHHMMAMSDDEASPASMKRAIVLYEMALQTQSQKFCLQPLGMNGFQLLLACYNNLGRAQQHKSTEKADLCFQSLLSLLMWAVVHKAVPAVSIDPYWGTVEHLLSSSPAPAAAA